MQITTVGVEYQRKFNLGDYESLELGISLYAKVNADEEAEAVAELLYEYPPRYVPNGTGCK